jgi:hypothetical protein
VNRGGHVDKSLPSLGQALGSQMLRGNGFAEFLFTEIGNLDKATSSCSSKPIHFQAPGLFLSIRLAVLKELLSTCRTAPEFSHSENHKKSCCLLKIHPADGNSLWGNLAAQKRRTIMKNTLVRLLVFAAVVASTSSLKPGSIQKLDGPPLPPCPVCPKSLK